MNTVHASLAAGRWQEMSLVEQMGNIGSEVHRVWKWRQKGDQEQLTKAFDRALELLDLSISDDRWKTGRKELVRAREVLADAYLGGREYKSKWQDLDNYFLHFALAARQGN